MSVGGTSMPTDEKMIRALRSELPGCSHWNSNCIRRAPSRIESLGARQPASNAASAPSSARYPGVGWCSNCAAIDCGAVGPASGSFAEWRTAFSNLAIAVVHGPASTDVTPRSNATPTNKTATAGRFMTKRDVLIPFCRSPKRRSNLRQAPGV
jgi:hypothetical protein